MVVGLALALSPRERTNHRSCKPIRYLNRNTACTRNTSSTQVLELENAAVGTQYRQIELIAAGHSRSEQRNPVFYKPRIWTHELGNELRQYKNGVFFGIGFGFNYFTSSPPKVLRQKRQHDRGVRKREWLELSFLSGFMAYKIKEKHSLIFNVPLGDVTNREEFKIGLFNQKMAGGIGYGRNLGNVSLIFIMNISPYESIEKELLL